MKQSLYIITLLTLFIGACQKDTSKETKGDQVESPKSTAITFPERAKDMTIYEVNVRQFTPEGTFNAFSDHLQELKNLGVDMLWFMPIQPIGEKNRKGPLGSYYSIQDYRTINPEFGTMDDFKALVKKAHDMDFVVILDWVPNHTSWDNPWITSHPEYYAKDSLGNITYEADWTDIALLDHTNPDTRKAMIDEMEYWIKEVDIDGFRCDHAGHEIPLYFWEEATTKLNPLKDLFWLAEWDQPRMHLEFQATYSWGLLHLTEAVAKGEEPAEALNTFVQKDLAEYGKKAYRLTLTTNHDENAWSGTVFERYGEGHKAFAAFVFTAYGIPMIYSGQEVGMDKRLAFFDKDSIDWSDPKKLKPFYKKLVQIRKDNPALWSGEYGAMPVIIQDKNDHVVSFSRTKDDNKVISIINFSDQNQSITTPGSVAGNYKDYISDEELALQADGQLELQPFEFHILIAE
ncbi:alpha-glucosidase C-terminal domain-containing protein [Fulvivirga maritima]|uniref:alpha-amylase family glycosyl hydrolase n=1 Tax=Fulvivirga maritima TaxID=2904247 RepID=UPI001F2A0962|nr:alpha-amylase family glycosyl hydrolase [Fulvivirga maritima]UII25273.1 alpha-glucosidase C-terminal domain-containing protein [Fulvivirga maritima]